MCGIVGAFFLKNSNSVVTEPYIVGMRDTMVHRGPDGAGIWISEDGKVGLGHRRLSIIDLSDNASQPMCNEDSSIWIVYNGEIYNHYEIRPELEKKGHRFKTDHSDTEVIIHAYEEWGVECIHRFRGMFAFAIWDERKRYLWLVRDRIGIKPLYYTINNNRVIFASEIKAILTDTSIPRSVNETAFYHYLSFLTTPSPQTMFDGIKKLPGSTWLKINEDGQLFEFRYWDVWDCVKPLYNVSENEISEILLDKLRIAVKYRKVSDVPVGIFLSGGIDSSTNAALFSEGENRVVKTFSVGYDGDYTRYKNEFNYARLMADKIGSEHHEKKLNIEDQIDFLSRLVYYQDEPLAEPSCIPAYFVSKLARENGIKVCQVGEGSDELFCGYPHWKRILKFAYLNDLQIPVFMKNFGLIILKLTRKDSSKKYEWLRRGISGEHIIWGGEELFTEGEKRKLISERLRKKFNSYSSYEVIKSIETRFREKAWEQTYLNWMSYLDLNFRLPELLLMRVDKMSMAVSLEARVPFLDHEFVEFAMSIPESIKIKNGELKYILKKAVNGIIPDELINRKKQGFGVPIYELFFDKFGDFAKNKLIDFSKKTDFFDKMYIEKLFQKNKGWHLWCCLNFTLWYDKWIR